MNIVQNTFLLGHAQLQTAIIYLEITAEQELKALETLENENERLLSKKWHNQNVNLSDFAVFVKLNCEYYPYLYYPLCMYFVIFSNR